MAVEERYPAEECRRQLDAQRGRLALLNLRDPNIERNPGFMLQLLYHDLPQCPIEWRRPLLYHAENGESTAGRERGTAVA